MNNRGIGVFDSGLGGLTVVKEIMKILPHERIIYLGDTARYPYGTKTKETIIRFSSENTEFLLDRKVKIIVAACNTASAAALASLKKNYDTDITGVVEAGAAAAVKNTKNNKIGVIGTRATINSGAYEKAIKKLDKNADITLNAAPLLAPLVEEGWINKKETVSILEYYLKPFKKKKVDTLLLGCTHYPLLKPLIKKLMPRAGIIDSASVTARRVRDMLDRKKMRAKKENRKRPAFYVTDTPDTFNKVGRMFLKKNMVPARKVSL